MSKYSIFYEEVKSLHKEGLTNIEISRELGIDSRRVSEILKKFGLKKNDRKFNEIPSKEQERIFHSMFLGDGSIYKDRRNVNYRVNLAHSDKQKDYFMHKYEIIKDFIGTEYWRESQFHKKTKKKYSAYKLQSLVNPYFTKMYSLWYRDGKKIIPDFIDEILDEQLLSFKYFDDGNLESSGYTISMNDYSKECVIRFAKAIYNNFGIKVNFHDDYKRIYIPARHKEEFREMLSKFATTDVLYKLGEFRETPNV